MEAGGERAGKRVRLTIDDALQLGELPLVKHASPELFQDVTVSYGTKQTSYLIRAVAPAYGEMRNEIPLPGGRFIDDEDVRLRRRVAFIGAEVNRKLFGESNAVGQTIRVRGMCVRSHRRDEGQGAAFELPPARQPVRLHPLHDRLAAVVPGLDRRPRVAGGGPLEEPEGRQAGARAARQGRALQSCRRARDPELGVGKANEITTA